MENKIMTYNDRWSQLRNHIKEAENNYNQILIDIENKPYDNDGFMDEHKVKLLIAAKLRLNKLLADEDNFLTNMLNNKINFNQPIQ